LAQTDLDGAIHFSEPIRMEILTSVSGSQTPLRFSLEQNYPNPFNPQTAISFSIPNKSKVKLIIFNSLGKEVATLVDKQLAVGTYSVSWNALGFPSGLYFCLLDAGAFTKTKKLVLLR
jgi:hypothetical protein